MCMRAQAYPCEGVFRCGHTEEPEGSNEIMAKSADANMSTIATLHPLEKLRVG